MVAIKAADSSPEATIRHVLHGIESVPQAFEFTAHEGKYQAINPAQVMMRAAGPG